MEYFPKDVLNYISKFLEIHDFHRIALCCKAFFRVYGNHVYQSFRSEKACLFRRRGFKENGHRNYCVKCQSWVHKNNLFNHKERCSYNKTLPIIKIPRQEAYMEYDPICVFIDHSTFVNGECPYDCLMRKDDCLMRKDDCLMRKESKKISSSQVGQIKMITI